MILMPKHFDLNEWLVLITSAIQLLVFWRLPKRFPRFFTVLNYLFTMFVVMSVDDILAVKPYDYYDWMDYEKFELFDIFTYLFMYPTMGYFFLHFYDQWKLKGWKLMVYMLIWTGLSAGYEWLCVICHVLLYKGWILTYSVPVYLAVFGIELLFWRFVRTRLHNCG